MLPKKFDPAMFDDAQNIFKLTFPASLQHDWEVECGKVDCRNPAHFRLLSMKHEVEINDSFSRIDAMRELWHNK